MRGCSVLESALLMGSSVFIGLSSRFAGWIDSIAHCVFSLKRILKDRHNRPRRGSAG